ncbi:hypothetical protein ACXR0O_09615 [Verrucomicrobiota bacterium sgz303538]
MNELDNFFSSALGVSVGTLRFVTAVSAIAVGVLYLYRLLTVAHCMRQPVEQFQAPIDRLIWVALAMLVPLGLGAWLYDLVRRGRPLPPLFVVPFAIVAICFLSVAIPLLSRSTKFNFNFLGV